VQFLEETILSILNQGYPNLEYIIIDGGSTDGTLEIIRKYEQYISFWLSEPDEGMYHAIQKGFNKSTGEIMAWLNSDDKYHEASLSMVASIFNDTKAEWITGIPSMYNNIGQCVSLGKIANWSRSRLWIMDYKWIQQENVFWKRSLWEKAGSALNTNLKYAGDFELWCRFFKFAELYPINTTLSGFRLHGSQLSLYYLKEYESEAKTISKKQNPLTIIDILRFTILYTLNALKNIITFSYILRFLNPLVNLAIKKLHCFPKIIYFNFTERKWTI